MLSCWKKGQTKKNTKIGYHYLSKENPAALCVCVHVYVQTSERICIKLLTVTWGRDKKETLTPIHRSCFNFDSVQCLIFRKAFI